MAPRYLDRDRRRARLQRDRRDPRGGAEDRRPARPPAAQAGRAPLGPPHPMSTSVETGLFRLATGLIGLHVLDDNFVQPQPGTGIADHLVSGLVPLALLALAAWAYPRLRPGYRGLLALAMALPAALSGVEAIHYGTATGLSGDDFTGLAGAGHRPAAARPRHADPVALAAHGRSALAPLSAPGTQARAGPGAGGDGGAARLARLRGQPCRARRGAGGGAGHGL